MRYGKDYKIYLKKAYGNKILYGHYNDEDKMMKVSNHLAKDMNCHFIDAYIIDNGGHNTVVYIFEEPKGAK